MRLALNLLVIDDVWDAAHLRPFLRRGKSTARLFTTRDANIAAEAVAVNVDEMRHTEAVALLAKSVPSLEGGAARDLARRLGEWPLALELAAAMMRERVRLSEYEQVRKVGHTSLHPGFPTLLLNREESTCAAYARSSREGVTGEGFLLVVT